MEVRLRLFVGLWPTAEVIKVLDGMARPDHPSTRWTGPGQWHVTLRFLGDVAEDEVPALAAALTTVGASAARQAKLGPATERLGRNLLVVPVAGVDDLADAVVEATAAFGPAPDRAFRGHLTLARGRRDLPSHLAGQQVEASWRVTEVCLVRSHLGSSGSRYETIATVPLRHENAHPRIP